MGRPGSPRGRAGRRSRAGEAMLVRRPASPAGPDRPRSEVTMQPLSAEAPAGPRIVFVAREGPADFRSVGEAVAASEPGTRIVVRPGLYQESVVLDRRVQLVGEGPVETV